MVSLYIGVAAPMSTKSGDQSAVAKGKAKAKSKGKAKPKPSPTKSVSGLCSLFLLLAGNAWPSCCIGNSRLCIVDAPSTSLGR